MKISTVAAEAFGRAAKVHNIALSLHAPYYISLSSVDPLKREGSVRYIIDSAIAANTMGADRIIVHSGSCAKISREEALELAKGTLKAAYVALKEHNLSHIHICPETMGKFNQLGDLAEVIELCRVEDSFIPCIDFGHLNARTLGGIKTEDDYNEILNKIENHLGYDRLKNFHSHFSKIEYTVNGGEKKHLTFEDSEFGPEFEPLVGLILSRGLSPRIICESDGTQAEDAAFMKNIYISRE